MSILFRSSQVACAWRNAAKLRQVPCMCTPAITKNYVTSVNKSQSAVSQNQPEWRVIYRLPIVNFASALSRLKLYQGALATIGTPAVYALEKAGGLPLNSMYVFSAIGVTGFLTLTLVSVAINNLIGFIYINNAEDRLKLAYINFWGKRKEAVVDIDDILPEIEKARPTRFDFYQAVRLGSNSSQKYKLLHRFGNVLDPNTFAELFGE